MLKYSEKTSRQIKRILKNYDDKKIEKVYYSEHPERRKLIVPVEKTYEQKLEEWIARPYEGKGFAEDATEIHSNNGVRVRSKSEKIIADYLESEGIAYKYECPLVLKTYGTVYPDFTILSRKTGEEIYWEHEGKMDDSEYVRTAIKKLDTYQRNNIFPGERLILTFETQSTIISSDIIRKLVSKYL